MASDGQPPDDLKAFEQFDELLTTPEEFKRYLVKRARAQPRRGKRRSPSAARTLAYRQRQRQGLAVIRLTLPLYPLVEFLISSGRLGEGQSLLRHHIERAASEALLELAQRWVGEHPTNL